MLIIRRVNCISTTSGICHCMPHGHLHRVTYTRGRIDTTDSPDDEHFVGSKHVDKWNKQIYEKELCVMLVIYKDCNKMDGQQNIKLRSWLSLYAILRVRLKTGHSRQHTACCIHRLLERLKNAFCYRTYYKVCKTLRINYI